MGITISNPYNVEIRELLKDSKGNLTEEEEVQLAYLQNESRLFIQKKLEELYASTQDVDRKLDQFRIDKPSLPLSKIYKQSTELYKENQRLTEAIRSLKKEIRDEIGKQRESNRRQQTTLTNIGGKT